MKSAIALSAAGVLAVACYAGPAAAQADACKVYVQTAVKLAQEAASKKCGFSGPEWSTDPKAQLSWCMGVSADRWRSDLPKRQQMVAQACKPAPAPPAVKK